MAAVGLSSDLLDGNEKQSQEPMSTEESLQDDTQSFKLPWDFQPLYSLYKTLKFSSEYLSKIFGIMEQIPFALLSLFERGDTLHECYQEQVKDDTLHPVLISLFRIGFRAHNNLRQSVLYIEKLYEEVVPLVPGQLPPFFDMNVDIMPVRTMCCYATRHMISRLSHHTVSSITNICRRIRSFIRKPFEETALEF